jgi:zinc/manganese transport system permease protein
VLAVSLGLGLLFLHFYTTYAGQATALLFGNVLGIGRGTLWALLALTIVVVGSLAVIARPLVFASLQPELAEAKGARPRRLAMAFLMIDGLATAATAQIVGILLVFTLMVAPAAAAQRLTTRLWPGVVMAVVLALAEAWAGLVLAFETDWPTSFWITALGGAIYLLACAAPHRRDGGGLEHDHAHGARHHH